MELTVLNFDSLPSTNTEAAEQARRGASEGLCVVAAQQTAGRGRYGRTWISPPGTGLYLSMILRPRISSQDFPLITLMAGIAVHDTLKAFGVDSDIKWVNDLLVKEKKISGILAEAIETNLGPAIVLGIGLNLKTPDGVPEGSSATSIFDTTGRLAAPAEAAEVLTRELQNWYEVLSGAGGPVRVRDEWARRSSYFRGKAVRVTLPTGIIEGVTDGLEANGALRVIDNNGALTVIQAGEVERLRPQAA